MGSLWSSEKLVDRTNRVIPKIDPDKSPPKHLNPNFTECRGFWVKLFTFALNLHKCTKGVVASVFYILHTISQKKITTREKLFLNWKFFSPLVSFVRFRRCQESVYSAWWKHLGSNKKIINIEISSDAALSLCCWHDFFREIQNLHVINFRVRRQVVCSALFRNSG